VVSSRGVLQARGLRKVISSMDYNKKYFGLIGYPVRHSFSADMHNAVFSYLNLNAEYKLFKVKPEELEKFLSFSEDITDIRGESINPKQLHGFNVTIPHKEAILKFVKVDQKDSSADEIGAVNTVCISGGKLKGYNTDSPGFWRDIKELKADIRRAAIIGAGGAAKAVAFALTRHHAQEIVVYDVDEKKGRKFLTKVKGWAKDCEVRLAESIADLNLADKTLLVNATPAGMRESDNVLVKEDMLHKKLFVYDLIYNPKKTKLLEMAEKKGLHFSNGLRMLLYQGMLSFKLWMDFDPPQNIMFNVIEEE